MMVSGQQLRVSVGGNAVRRQSLACQFGAEVRHRTVRLMQSKSSRDHRVAGGVHHDRHSRMAFAQIRTVNDQMTVQRQITRTRHRMRQPIRDDATHGADAQTALAVQLTHVIPFAHPAREPDPLPVASIAQRPSHERPAAPTTTPSLFAGRHCTRARHTRRAAMRTPFFEPFLKPLRKFSYNTMTANQIQPKNQHILAIMPIPNAKS